MVIETLERFFLEAENFQRISSSYSAEWDDVVAGKVSEALDAICSKLSSLGSELENERDRLIAIEEELSFLAGK